MLGAFSCMSFAREASPRNKDIATDTSRDGYGHTVSEFATRVASKNISLIFVREARETPTAGWTGRVLVLEQGAIVAEPERTQD
jgi:hypothetical protein